MKGETRVRCRGRCLEKYSASRGVDKWKMRGSETRFFTRTREARLCRTSLRRMDMPPQLSTYHIKTQLCRTCLHHARRRGIATTSSNKPTAEEITSARLYCSNLLRYAFSPPLPQTISSHHSTANTTTPPSSSQPSSRPPLATPTSPSAPSTSTLRASQT